MIFRPFALLISGGAHPVKIIAPFPSRAPCRE
jgi:hypothetical protein